MGVAFYAQGYIKNEECITGRIKALGWYEVNTSKIQSFKIANTFTVIHDEIYSFTAIAKTFYYFGMEDAGELTFYQNVMNGITGHGMYYEDGETYGVMFEGKKIHSIVSNILDNFEAVEMDQSKMQTEKENLLNLQKVLEVIAKNDGLVGFVWS